MYIYRLAPHRLSTSYRSRAPRAFAVLADQLGQQDKTKKNYFTLLFTYTRTQSQKPFSHRLCPLPTAFPPSGAHPDFSYMRRMLGMAMAFSTFV